MKKNTKSVKSRLLIPFAAILLIQTVLLSLFIFCGGVSASLRSNAVDIFRKNTENSELNLEREVVQHWMNDIRSSETIRDAVQRILEKEGKLVSDIKTDPELNKEIVYGVMPRMIELLHRSYGNGVFLILDGPASNNGAPEEKAGVYISDLDSSSYATDNSDLMLVRGLPSISREYGIALVSQWSLGFNLDESAPASDYYYKPYQSAVSAKIDIRDVGNYAYLGSESPQGGADAGGISYSVPLVLEDGTTIGVLGGDMLENHVQKIMDAENLSGSVDTAMILAKHESGSRTLEPVVTSGAVYDRYFGRNKVLEYQPAEQDQIGTVKDINGDIWYAAMIPMTVYNHNTPFEKEEWNVVQLQREDTLMNFYNQIRSTLLIYMIVSLLLGILATMLVGNLVAGPIQKLIEELRSAGIGQKIHLKKTRISEVDELIDAIEGLSSDVAESALRISRILDASGVAIGVFEYLRGTGKVFCSRSLFQLLWLDGMGEDYEYLPLETFKSMMQVLYESQEEDDGSVYYLRKDEEYRYVRLNLVNAENGNVTGVLSEVTADVETRKKLERERNYDILTGIYNRRAFRELADIVLNKQKVNLALLVMWDLDNLKYVNDTYGHETGDRYIRLFADYLKTMETEGGVVERHSGDEFMALLYNGSEAKLRGRVRKFMEQLKTVTLEVAGGYQIPLRASAGMVWYPNQADNLDTMIQYADFAMYMAKHSVKGIVQEFDIQSYRANAYLLSGGEELNLLLEGRNVKFALQPIVARDGSIYGYEALMRPQLNSFKNIQEVLNLAKAQAKLPQFEELTWFAAMEWLSVRKHLVGDACHFFINSIASVSMTEERVKQLAAMYPDMLHRIVMEITETEQVDENGMSIKISTLHDWGGLVALDDFGAGYSTESVLLRLRPNLVKLDIELISHIDEDVNRRAVACNLIEYCHERGVLVVAEGVERLEELETLMQLQVDLFQGYYLARPEVEIRPLNPYVIEKLQELSKK